MKKVDKVGVNILNQLLPSQIHSTHLVNKCLTERGLKVNYSKDIVNDSELDASNRALPRLLVDGDLALTVYGYADNQLIPYNKLQGNVSIGGSKSSMTLYSDTRANVVNGTPPVTGLYATSLVINDDFNKKCIIASKLIYRVKSFTPIIEYVYIENKSNYICKVGFNTNGALSNNQVLNRTDIPINTVQSNQKIGVKIGSNIGDGTSGTTTLSKGIFVYVYVSGKSLGLTPAGTLAVTAGSTYTIN